METAKRDLTEDLSSISSENDWKIVEGKKKKKKKRRVSECHEAPLGATPLPSEAPVTPASDPPPATPSSTARFKVKACVAQPVNLLAMLGKDPRLDFTAKPNQYREWILYTRSSSTIQCFSKMNQLEPLKERTRKAVILHYPVELTLEPVMELPNVLTVYRCTTKTKEPLRKLIATFRDTIPDKIKLKVWGSFPTKAFTPEPLRCFRCQKFGHHQARCTSELPTCGVCSMQHPTENCIAKLKAQEVTSPKCPNCSKRHHAWSRFCRARIEKIKLMKEKQSPPSPPPTAPKPAPLLSSEDFPDTLRRPAPPKKKSKKSKTTQTEKEKPIAKEDDPATLERFYNFFERRRPELGIIITEQVLHCLSSSAPDRSHNDSVRTGVMCGLMEILPRLPVLLKRKPDDDFYDESSCDET